MTEKGKFAVAFLSAVLTSMVLLETGVGLFIFAIPLLLVAEKIQHKATSLCVFGSALLAFVATRIYNFRGFFTEENLGIILMDGIFPIIVVAECFLFVLFRDRTDSFLRRLVLSARAAIVIGLACGLYLSSPAGEPVLEGFVAAIRSTLDYYGESLGVNFTDQLIPYFTGILVFAPVPIGMALAGLQIWIAENLLHKVDQDWQMGFAYMKMPGWYTWLFMGLWALVIAAQNVQILSGYCRVFAWNTALGLSLHFFMNGVSVVTAGLRRHSAFLTAGKICVWVLILSFIPVANLVMFLGLIILGVLETWVKMR